MNFTKYFSKQRTPQRMAIPGTTQVPNSAGGYAWAVDDWACWIASWCLAEAAPTISASRVYSADNAAAVQRCLAADGPRVVAYR